MSGPPVLEVDGLETRFGSGRHTLAAVRDVSFSIAPGEVLGLIGESGSGKTVTGLSVLRLLPDHARIDARRIAFKGEDLTALPPARLRERLRALRGTGMAMIFQDPAGSFNPAKTIGWHLRHAIRRSQAGAEPAGLLAEVGIAAPARVLDSYPHQLSGGMLQRALIAMVSALHPALIIADEPTTNLDNLVERQILELIRTHRQRLGAAVLFITHDLVIAGEVCDRIAVMYAGEIVEIGPAPVILRRPHHPYAAALLATAQSLERRDEYLAELPGEPGRRGPDGGCGFAARCPNVMPRCRAEHPALLQAGPHHQSRCWLDAA